MNETDITKHIKTHLENRMIAHVTEHIEAYLSNLTIALERAFDHFERHPNEASDNEILSLEKLLTMIQETTIDDIRADLGLDERIPSERCPIGIEEALSTVLYEPAPESSQRDPLHPFIWHLVEEAETLQVWVKFYGRCIA